jgi:peptide subunit release factor 1 (eRF1)
MSLEKIVKEIGKLVDAACEEAREEGRVEAATKFRGGIANIFGKKLKGAKVATGTPSPARQLQGKYMGMLRAYSATEAKAIKAIAKDKGVKAAIKAMKNGFTLPKKAAPKVAVKIAAKKSEKTNGGAKPKIVFKQPEAPPDPPASA